MAETIRLASPAKVNLRLEILRKREDGYHELRTLFQKVDLLDTVTLSLSRGRGIVITTNHPTLPVGKANLVYRAVQALMEKTDCRGRVEVRIEKSIPIGAGLGGGSSNAAAAMKGMNELLRLRLPRKELMELGVTLGADVPFFFLEGAAIGRGIGERLRKVKLPEFRVVLIYPNFEVSTRWAYEAFRLTRGQFRINIRRFLETPEGISRILWNDLEQVVSNKFPEIRFMKEALCSAGAMGALMTGSGPTVFGIFEEEAAASEGYRKVRNRVRGRGWQVFKARSID